MHPSDVHIDIQACTRSDEQPPAYNERHERMRKVFQTSWKQYVSIFFTLVAFLSHLHDFKSVFIIGVAGSVSLEVYIQDGRFKHLCRLAALGCMLYILGLDAGKRNCLDFAEYR